MSCKAFLKEEFRLVNFWLRHHEPHRFVNAESPQVHGLVYVIYRWIIASFLVAVSIVSGIRTGSEHYLIYLTHWTLLSLTFSHVVRAGSALHYHVTKPASGVVKGESHQDFMPWYMKLLWTTFNASSAPSLSVTGLYWTVVYGGKAQVDFVNFAVHGSNSIIVMLDHFITGVPVRVLHAHHPVIYSLTYSLFTVIYYYSGGTTSTGDTAIYAALDYKNSPGQAVGLLLGASFVLIPLLHVMLFGLYKLRVYLYRKCCPRNSVGDSPTGSQQNDLDVEIGNPAFSEGDKY